MPSESRSRASRGAPDSDTLCDPKGDRGRDVSPSPVCVREMEGGEREEEGSEMEDRRVREKETEEKG
eukprot:3073415-Rhodomonas_salina.1